MASDLLITPLGTTGWACGSDHPFYIVYHGRESFEYPHFGVHLGQEDRLTFLGDSSRRFLGRFLDCRAGSRTHGAHTELELRPDASQCLVIPAGVGHSFSGLEDIYAINSYRLLLLFRTSKCGKGTPCA
ncbi:MAG: dTDP-4-dehydrorhamnose 3,5-epimerase family protein [Microvirga sp.]